MRQRIAEMVGNTVLNSTLFKQLPRPLLEGAGGGSRSGGRAALRYWKSAVGPERWRPRLERNPALAKVSPLRGGFAGANSGVKKRFLSRLHRHLFHKSKEMGVEQ